MAFQDINSATLATTISQVTDTTTARPSFIADFMNAQQMDPRIVMYRASTATYVGRNGQIQTANYNQPRFDFDPVTGQCKGLLIEEGRTNLCTYSSDLSQASPGVYNNWTQATVTTDTAVAPDGTTTADTFSGNAPTATRAWTFAATAGTTYTFSMYVKRNPASNDTNLNYFSASIAWSNNGSTLTGYTTAGLNVHTLPQGVWTRVSTSYTCPTGATSMQFGPSNGGQGSPGDQLYSLFIWGCQIEAGSFPTSYIPTSGASATRAYDSAIMAGGNLYTLLNQGFNTSMVGTVFASFQPNNTVGRESDFLSFAGSGWLRFINDNTYGAAMEINGTANPNIAGGAAGWRLPGGQGANLSGSGKVNNMVFSINYTDASFAANGILGVQAAYPYAKPYYPYPTGMYLGSIVGGYTNLWANGWIRKIAIYNTVLSDAELVEMTR
jgi:hypothetical protein